jgi:copper(I)-binding protein
MRAITLAVCAVLAAGPALAADVTAKGLTIGHPWTRPAAAGGNAAGYLTIANTGAADTLLSVETPAAKSATLHHSGMNGMVMQMRPLSGLTVPAKGKAVLAPGGDHIMFAGLTNTLSQGQTIPVTLVFQRAGRIKIDLAVEISGPSTSTVVQHDHH